MPSLNERLKWLRSVHQPKLTQQALAEELNISRATYGRYETGDNEPDIDTLRRLAELYKISIEYLITGEEFSGNVSKFEIDNPKIANLFNDLLKAPGDKVEELIQFWEFIKIRK
ncbi:helix-turn-helix domain-containing protein [Bacillus pumilus]|uniref:helix-turn-helix domain-containing protein n=1 Tax=Bacillus pumilus TaxID=1408 RepID=UPI002281B5C2|nr:helix-turn-helix transcriptional regulator [Bacillus pumilus]MCY7500090.1 helix-turn-helix domain-containing protein [Bacillus pumilus]MCY7528586.1 helix-turn-helix domain-containing protein [Bacillus pumilus]MED4439454.1 helix-turn-helix transcriptional regulator [Bacillus pumilus]MED4489897.1 helix-turn-helix transcriptional regulator [Bacillus pumilus]